MGRIVTSGRICLQQSKPLKYWQITILGRHPNTGKEIEKLGERNPSADKFPEEMSCMRKEVEEALKRTNEMMKQKFNKNKGPERQFDIGDLV